LLAASAPDTSDARTILPQLDVDANELALVYRAGGIPAEVARRQAVEVLRSHDPAADVEAATPDGDGSVVIGTSVGAAVSSFLFFATGAAVPMIPFVVGLQGVTAVVVSAVLVGLALMLTGATVGVLSGGPPLRRALRQLAIGAGAAAVTYGLGTLFGAALG
ncbi:MAG: VIT1/CCC1 transporter family protein, partial [Pseudonocardia sediminis]